MNFSKRIGPVRRADPYFFFSRVTLAPAQEPASGSVAGAMRNRWGVPADCARLRRARRRDTLWVPFRREWASLQRPLPQAEERRDGESGSIEEINAMTENTPSHAAVFVSGSLSIASLPEPVIERIDGILDRGLPILIGDARGVDRAVQRFLSDRNSDDVSVYCSGDGPRNNVGEWPVRSIPSSGRKGTAAYHPPKMRRWRGMPPAAS